MDIWLFTNECIVFCIVLVSHTRLDLTGNGTPWVNSGTIPAILGWLASLIASLENFLRPHEAPPEVTFRGIKMYCYCNFSTKKNTCKLLLKQRGNIVLLHKLSLHHHSLSTPST